MGVYANSLSKRPAITTARGGEVAVDEDLRAGDREVGEALA
jgi:hypothetical protein